MCDSISADFYYLDESALDADTKAKILGMHMKKYESLAGEEEDYYPAKLMRECKVKSTKSKKIPEGGVVSETVFCEQIGSC